MDQHPCRHHQALGCAARFIELRCATRSMEQGLSCLIKCCRPYKKLLVISSSTQYAFSYGSNMCSRPSVHHVAPQLAHCVPDQVEQQCLCPVCCSMSQHNVGALGLSSHGCKHLVAPVASISLQARTGAVVTRHIPNVENATGPALIQSAVYHYVGLKAPMWLSTPVSNLILCCRCIKDSAEPYLRPQLLLCCSGYVLQPQLVSRLMHKVLHSG